MRFVLQFSNPSYKIAVLKYRGGGDWYANLSSLTNLITFSNENIKTSIQSNMPLLKWEA